MVINSTGLYKRHLNCIVHFLFSVLLMTETNYHLIHEHMDF